MKVYEYKCLACSDRVVSKTHLESEWDLADLGHVDSSVLFLEAAAGPDACGPLKRVWSAGIVWPMSERGH